MPFAPTSGPARSRSPRGDEGRARGIYLESRAQSLREEASVAEKFLRLLRQSEDSAVQVRNAVVFYLARPAGGRAESPG